MKALLAVIMLALSGVAIRGDAAAIDPEGDTDLGISAERLGVINERTQAIWMKLRADGSRRDLNDTAWVNSELRRTVWEFNLLREELCRDRFMVEQTCGRPFVPKWAYDGSKGEPTAKELRAREEELEEHVVPLWDAACERLKKAVSEDASLEYCSME